MNSLINKGAKEASAAVNTAFGIIDELDRSFERCETKEASALGKRTKEVMQELHTANEWLHAIIADTKR